MGLMHLIMPDFEASKGQVSVGVWAILLVPPTLIRSMKSIATLSFVAFVGGLVMVVALVICCVSVIASGDWSPSDIDWFPKQPVKLATAGPLLCLCFAIQAGGGAVFSTMQDTSPANIKKVAGRAFLTVFVMDVTVGVIAYLAFQGATKGDVIENLPNGNPAAVIAQVCLLDLVVLSYMIMAIPCKISLLDTLFHKNEAKMESSTAQYYGVTAVLNVLALCMALAVPDLSLINGLNGAICTNMNAFIMPPIFYVVMRSRPLDPTVTERVPIFSMRNIPHFLLALFGTFQMVLGGYQVIGTMLNPASATTAIANATTTGNPPSALLLGF